MPAASAAAIRETEPQAAVRMVILSWAVRVRDMVGVLRSVREVLGCFVTSTIADRADTGPSPI
ncbi:hypothetical protein GCM10023334_116500 [Nonomuraea thailandensis]